MSVVKVVHRPEQLPVAFQYPCAICLISINEGDPRLAWHKKGGEKHLLHKSCLKDWIEYKPAPHECPVCCQRLRTGSLFSCGEKMKSILKRIFCVCCSR